MGFMSCLGECVRCHALFSFNPERVPCVVVNGHREPLCRECVEWANERRKALGLPEIKPLPGAYEAEEIQ
jgi:hypothetical protein